MPNPKNVTEKLNNVLGVAKDLLDESESVFPEELAEIKEITGELQTTPSKELAEKARIPRIKSTELMHPPRYDNDLENDYDHVRQVLRGLITNGELTLDALLCVAQDMQNPRAYEVAGQLIKTIADVTSELIGLQKKMKELKRENVGDNKGQTIQAENVQQNTYVFNGTTAELQQFIKDAMKK